MIPLKGGCVLAVGHDGTARWGCGWRPRGAYKSQHATSRLHFLFLSIKNDKLERAAGGGVPVCSSRLLTHTLRVEDE